MSTQPNPLQTWVNDTKPMLGQAVSKQPPPVKPMTPEDLARRKEQWIAAVVKPAQQQVDAKLAAINKILLVKAQVRAGQNADVGFITDALVDLQQQFAAEAVEMFPDRDKVSKLLASFGTRIQSANQDLTALIQNNTQFGQKVQQRAAENEQRRKELIRAWSRKIQEPLAALPDSQKAIRDTCLAEAQKFEAALKAGKIRTAEQIFTNAAEVVLPKALSDYKLQQDKEAYITQMMKKVSAEFNPGNKFDPQKMEMWQTVIKDLTDHTGSGLSEAEVLAVRVYTASNYKYINPAVANQKDRKDRPTDWMDNTHKPDPSKAEEILKQRAKEHSLPDPTPQQIQAKREQLQEQLEEYEKTGKQQLYEEGALHAGMMMEAFKKLPKKTGKLYRGARMNQAMFDREYKVGNVMEYEAFVSNATQPSVARGFADGNDGANPDQTISVFAEAEVLDARDIMALSVYKRENEWLVPPGTKLKVEKIEDDPVQHPGSSKAPPATAWKKVFLKQVLAS